MRGTLRPRVRPSPRHVVPAPDCALGTAQTAQQRAARARSIPADVLRRQRLPSLCTLRRGHHRARDEPCRDARYPLGYPGRSILPHTSRKGPSTHPAPPLGDLFHLPPTQQREQRRHSVQFSPARGTHKPGLPPALPRCASIHLSIDVSKGPAAPSGPPFTRACGVPALQRVVTCPLSARPSRDAPRPARTLRSTAMPKCGRAAGSTAVGALARPTRRRLCDRRRRAPPRRAARVWSAQNAPLHAAPVALDRKGKGEQLPPSVGRLGLVGGSGAPSACVASISVSRRARMWSSGLIGLCFWRCDKGVHRPLVLEELGASSAHAETEACIGGSPVAVDVWR